MKKPLILLTLLSCSFSIFAQQRIISAGSSVTELIYALQAEDSLVAVDSTSRDFVAGTSIPQVGYHRQLSTEGLLALNPTHLIGSIDMGPQSALRQLESADVNVVIVPSGDEISDLYARIDQIAKVTSNEKNAQKIKADIKNAIQRLNHQKSPKPSKVLFLLINDARPLSVGGANTTIDKIITLAGAHNPAKESVTSYKSISQEAIVAMQPDYILISQRAWDEVGGVQGVLDSHPLLKATPAGKKRQILAIPGHALIGGFGLQSIKLSLSLNETFSE